MPVATCGEALVELLSAHGVDTVFGIPGVHTVELYRGFPRSGLRHITPRHEQGAGFMADGYARASGKPAACFIITGPGLTNIATALGQAYADSVPILVISSVNNAHELGLGEGRLHELPSQRNLMAGLTAFSHTLNRADEVPIVLSRAFSVFRSARPRPVHIEIPLDVIVAPANERIASGPTALSFRPHPDPQSIAVAADLLRQARRPLIVLGGGAQDAAEAARHLVDRLEAPAVLTINGKGILPGGHPLSLGSSLPQAPMHDEFAAADVVLAIGTELGETDTLLFNERPKIGGTLIRVDIDPAQLASNAIADIGIVADAEAALRALNDALSNYTPADRNGRGRVESLRTAIEHQITPRQHLYQRILDRVIQGAPDTIIVGDSTQLIYSGNLTFEPRRPRSWFNATTGYGTLGYALPAALGAKLARPERPVLAVIGDGGLQFTIAELATAVELALAVPILVWNNRGYGEIKRYMAERNIPQIGVDIYTPDLLSIGRGFGCAAVRARSLEELGASVESAHRAGGPTLIEVDEADALTW
jgi:acetolactate synthase I/II/III large subunit